MGTDGVGPSTSSLSEKRSTAELNALVEQFYHFSNTLATVCYNLLMSEGGEIFHIPEIEPQDRAQVYEDLKTQIIDSLRGKDFALGIFRFDSESYKGIVTRDLSTSHGEYKFTRNLESAYAEITIQRNSRMDNPNIALEEIRFRVGRPGISPDVPDIEYHRTLKNGGSRTLKNNVLALKKTEEFIKTMKMNISQES